eukprot:COSAG02_NODE_18326_length_945_cov_1.460993_2_plen_143_part_00
MHVHTSVVCNTVAAPAPAPAPTTVMPWDAKLDGPGLGVFSLCQLSTVPGVDLCQDAETRWVPFDWRNEWGWVAFRRLGQCYHTFLVKCDNTRTDWKTAHHATTTWNVLDIKSRRSLKRVKHTACIRPYALCASGLDSGYMCM